MKIPFHSTSLRLCLTTLLLSLSMAASLSAQEPAVTLTEQGKKLEQHYSALLDSLRAEVVKSLPGIEAQKKAAFLDARSALARLKPPGEDADVQVRKAYDASQSLAEAKTLDAARVILNDVDGTLENNTLDSKLMTSAIIRHGTPRGLAEFAQQGEEEKRLLDQLFADEVLMKQILVAGGANGGEYGEAMQVYHELLESSQRARQLGSIYQRLALGTALQQPWLEGKDKGGVHGIVYSDYETPDGQVSRYLHYEKAHVAGELDPSFKDMNTWECRFISNDPYTNEDLGWTREMLRNYRPDHIANPDYKWRYARFVKSDVPYQSPTWDPKLGTKSQQIVAGGGKCGPRAFFGRTVSRAFGIPSRRSTQTGHAAMNHWTPDGWVVCFGGWWSMNWCGPWTGLDFLLDSQAREHPQEYLKVLRAQWIGDAMGEENVSIRNYGKGGGFWDGLAFYKKRAVVADAEVEALELVGGMKLGESDELLGDEKAESIQISEEDRKIVVDKNGMFTIPAAACSRPTNSTDKIAFIESWGGGVQVHYSRLGVRPELLRYTIELPAAGKYELVARVATVSTKQQVIFRLNRRTLVDVPLPYTKGAWEQTKPQTVELREGRNSIMLTCRAPNRGVSIKEFSLKPVAK